MTERTEPILLYWRIFLVLWGTVVGTGLFMSAVNAIWGDRPNMLAGFGLDGIGFGAVISISLTMPMLVVWMPVFSVIRTRTGSLRAAAALTTAGVVAMVAVVLVLAIGLLADDALSLFIAFLPWMPVVAGVGACLAWYAFEAEEILGTR